MLCAARADEAEHTDSKTAAVRRLRVNCLSIEGLLGARGNSAALDAPVPGLNPCNGLWTFDLNVVPNRRRRCRTKPTTPLSG